MTYFSERYGHIAPKLLQVESIDSELRASIWNVLETTMFGEPEFMEARFEEFSTDFWVIFLKLPLSSKEEYPYVVKDQMESIYGKLEWFQVYDFIEFVCKWLYKSKNTGTGAWKAYSHIFNKILEREKSGYRLVNRLISPITDEHEALAVEESIQNAVVCGAAEHFRNALQLLSDRQSPQFRKSIQESLSGLESTAQVLSAKPNASLGEALDELHRQCPSVSKTAVAGFKTLYGGASQTGGVRHGSTKAEEMQAVDLSDAKYYLVICSAMANFLKGKAATGFSRNSAEPTA
ncbi:AbiJ-NTD4 domain-containing protein [Allohahella marinimesophila]|uniref:HEPN AbiJ-N-terminal domain-containing protein n=1 Tax=Allohahella marinimesophila TaxID=1054972 RepID=A0ABP7NV24_9GAMM